MGLLLLLPSAVSNISTGPKTWPVSARRRVEIAFGNGPYDSAPVFTEVSHALRDESTPIKMKRGRQNELQQYDSGDFSCILDNRTRRFEPELTTGPFYPNIQPEKKLRYTLEYPWLPGLIKTPTFQGLGTVTTSGLPLLFVKETNLNLGEWVPSGHFTPNCTLAVQSGAGYMKDLSGNAYPSLRVTATAAADVYFDNGLFYPVTAGVGYATSFRAKGVTTGRTLELHMQWYNAAFTLISDVVTTYNIVGQTEVAGTYTRFGAYGVAPAGAAYVYLSYRILVPGAGEQHDFDCFVLQDHVSFQGIFPRCVTFVDSWLPAYPPNAIDSYVTVSSHDGFKLLGGKDLTDVGYAGAVKAMTPSHYYRLGDTLNSLTAADEMSTTPANAYAGIVFGVQGGLLADINTAALVDGGWIDCGTAPAWSGTGAQSVTFLYLWENTFQTTIPQNDLMSQGPFADNPHYQWRISPGLVGGLTTLQFTVIDYTAGGGPGSTLVQFEFPAPIQDQQYHLVTLNRHSDGVTYEVFVDGVAVTPNNAGGSGSISGTTYVAASAYNFDASRVLLGTDFSEQAIGVGNGGILDEVAFWNGSILTLAQHQSLWNIMQSAWVSQSSGQRMGAVLDLLGWPSTDRNLDAGDQILPKQVDPLAGPNNKTNTLDYLRVIEQSEGGQMFMDNQGRVRLIGRHNQFRAPYTVVQAVFGDRPGTLDTPSGLVELPYSSPKPDFGDSNLYTEAEVTRAIPGGGTGVTQWAHDPAIVNNPKRVATRSGLLLQSDEEAWNYSNWLFRSFSIARYMFRQIIINPVENDALWYQMCVREIGDRICVIKRPAGWTVGQPLIRVEATIGAIEESGKRGESQFALMLGQITATPYLVLDDPVLGKLDAGNFVGY